MLKDVFYPNVVTNLSITKTEFDNLNLGDVESHNHGQDLIVVKKMSSSHGQNRVNLCRTRTSAENCAICTSNGNNCEFPIKA